jgi:hypothetical protein
MYRRAQSARAFEQGATAERCDPVLQSDEARSVPEAGTADAVVRAGW